MEVKTQKKFTYEGFGFPVELLNVPMVKVRGTWTPDINYNILTERVTKFLALQPTALTGNQVRHIRLVLEMTLEKFAAKLGVTHVAVMKWEKQEDNPTKMGLSTEILIRLFALHVSGVTPRVFQQAYDKITDKALTKKKSKPKIDWEDLALAI